MTLRVLRYDLPVRDRLDFPLQAGAKLLAVRPTGLSTVEIWALVDEAQPMSRRRLKMAGTGHAINPDEVGEYVGTTVAESGGTRLVWHIWDLGEVVPEVVVAHTREVAEMLG